MYACKNVPLFAGEQEFVIHSSEWCFHSRYFHVQVGHEKRHT